MKLANKLFLPGILLFTCVLTFINSGCKKVSDLNPTPKSTDYVFNPDTLVYVLGYTGPAADSSYMATVWKNGVGTQLPALPGHPSTYGGAMVVSGSDVYVAGGSGTPGNTIASIPVYWKNGTVTQLNAPSAHAAYTSGIAVSGNDVYIGGTVGNDHTYGNTGDAGYWKNGVFTSLADPANYYNSSVWNIAVSGTDVYVCGEIEDLNGEKAVYWKNGVLHPLTDYSKFAWATKIYIQNNDVYVVYDQMKKGTDLMQAHYLKNDVDVQLPTDLDASYVSDLVLNGSDAYIAGYTATPVSSSVAHTEAVLWKNNVAQKLFDGGTSQGAYAYAVTVSGSNIYVAGQEGHAFGFWKSGVFAKMPDAASVNAITVVPKSVTP